MNDEKKEQQKAFDGVAFFSSEYIKSIAQVDFLKEIAPKSVKENMSWISERKAQTLFFKSPDLLVFDKNNKIDWKITKKLHEIQNERNLKDELFYLTAKKLCYNNLEETNAHAIWTIDKDSDGKPYANLIERSDIISITINNINNSLVACTIRKLIYENDGTKYYLVEKRSTTKIETEMGSYNENKFQKAKDNEIPEVIKAIYKDKLGEKEWSHSVTPFEYIKNTPDLTADISYIKLNLQKEIMLTGQEYIEIVISGTKVVIDKSTNQNIKKSDDNKTDKTAAIKMASQPVIELTKSFFPGQSPNPQIAPGQSQSLESYERLRKANKNEMLQKIGAAIDVDSKGSVEQSSSEILLSKGDEYKVVQWKNSYFQSKIQSLMHKFAVILKEGDNKAFKNYDRVQVFLAQNEVVSESDLIRNLTEAVAQGLISKELAIARFNKINLYEAHELLELIQKDKDLEQNSHILGQNNDISGQNNDISGQNKENMGQGDNDGQTTPNS